MTPSGYFLLPSRGRRKCLLAGLAWAGLLAGAGLPGQARAAHALFARSFPDALGGAQPMSAYLGRPLLLNFWATWCAPCIKEMPDLDGLQQRHPQVQVLGIAVDTAANVQRFGERVQVSYPLLVAGHGGVALMKTVGNPRGALPFTVLFDADGQPRQHWLGQIDPERLEPVLAGYGTNGQKP